MFCNCLCFTKILTFSSVTKQNMYFISLLQWKALTSLTKPHFLTKNRERKKKKHETSCFVLVKSPSTVSLWFKRSARAFHKIQQLFTENSKERQTAETNVLKVSAVALALNQKQNLSKRSIWCCLVYSASHKQTKKHTIWPFLFKVNHSNVEEKAKV